MRRSLLSLPRALAPGLRGHSLLAGARTVVPVAPAAATPADAVATPDGKATPFAEPGLRRCVCGEGVGAESTPGCCREAAPGRNTGYIRHSECGMSAQIHQPAPLPAYSFAAGRPSLMTRPIGAKAVEEVPFPPPTRSVITTQNVPGGATLPRPEAGWVQGAASPSVLWFSGHSVCVFSLSRGSGMEEPIEDV